MSPIHRTVHIPILSVYQNNLDFIHDVLEKFCKNNKKYAWVVLGPGGGAIGKYKSIRYLHKNQPAQIDYKVVSTNGDEELTIRIANGITLSITNGQYGLYGLMSAISDSLKSFQSPQLMVVLRRYWAVNTFIALCSFLILQINISSDFLTTTFLMLLLVIIGLGALGGLGYLASESSLSEILLDTKIRYSEYNEKNAILLSSLITSFPSLVSVLASIATIISFVILLRK